MRNRRIRVMHVVQSLEPGGMENGIVNVANRLDPNVFKLSVCCLVRRGSFADRLPESVQVFCLDKPPGKSWRTIVSLRRLLREQRPHVIHSHNLGPLIYSVGAALGTDIPILQGEHGQLVLGDLSANRIRFRKLLYRRCLRVQGVCQSLAEHLVDLGFDQRKICYVTNGVDVQRFCPAETCGVASDLTDSAGITIGIVGRLTPLKRHGYLLRAVAALREEGLSVRLLIVGDGPELRQVESDVAALGLTDHVTLAGHQEDPLPWYRQMDLHVLPTEQEGLSNVMLESMACGVPCLANDACGTREIVDPDSNGWLADVTSVEKLTAKLRMILSNPEQLAAFRQTARQKIVDAFSMEAMTQGYTALYQACAKQ